MIPGILPPERVGTIRDTVRDANTKIVTITIGEAARVRMDPYGEDRLRPLPLGEAAHMDTATLLEGTDDNKTFSVM